MHNAKLVEVSHALAQLIGELLRTLLWKCEPSLRHVVKEVAAIQVVENDVVGFTVLKQVKELDDVFVLAHLQHFNLSTLLEDLDRLHVVLLDSLDSDLFACNLVSGQCDHAELTLAKLLAHLVVVEEVVELYGLIQHLDPVLLLLTAIEVENARLTGGQHDLD